MPSDTTGQPQFSHVGICVADLDRSLAFYCDGLGFEKAESYEVGNEVSKTMELNGVSLRSQFIRRADGLALELLWFESPDCIGPRERRAMNQYGLTHLSFYVDDIDAAAARIRKCGGTVHDNTRTDTDAISLIFCTDPNGVRVELMQAHDA